MVLGDLNVVVGLVDVQLGEHLGPAELVVELLEVGEVVLVQLSEAVELPKSPQGRRPPEALGCRWRGLVHSVGLDTSTFSTTPKSINSCHAFLPITSLGLPFIRGCNLALHGLLEAVLM